MLRDKLDLRTETPRMMTGQTKYVRPWTGTWKPRGENGSRLALRIIVLLGRDFVWSLVVSKNAYLNQEQFDQTIIVMSSETLHPYWVMMPLRDSCLYLCSLETGLAMTRHRAPGKGSNNARNEGDRDILRLDTDKTGDFSDRGRTPSSSGLSWPDCGARMAGDSHHAFGSEGRGGESRGELSIVSHCCSPQICVYWQL